MRTTWHEPVGQVGIVTCPFGKAKGAFCPAAFSWNNDGDRLLNEGVVLGMADDGVHVKVFWPNWSVIEHRPEEIYHLRLRGAYKLLQRRALTARAGRTARYFLKLHRAYRVAA